MRSWLIALSGCAIIAAAPASASAQLPGRVAVDLSVGGGSGQGGKHVYTDRGQALIELLVGVRAQAQARVTRAYGVALGGRTRPATADLLICLRDPSSPGGECLPTRHFPAIGHLAALGGVERGGGHTSLRLLAGPAFYSLQQTSGAGAQLRLDAAAGARHLQFVLSARGDLLFRFNGEQFRLFSLGLGLRVQ